MFRTTHTIKQVATVVALAATIALLAVPSALAGGSSLLDGRSPDTRDAAAAAARANPSYGAPDGWYGYAVTLTKQQKQSTLSDGRSPDTRDAAAAVSAQSLTPLDGRSQDTRDAAVQAHASVITIVRSPGFEWSDFGIGVAAAFGLMLLAAVSSRVLTTRNRQPGPVGNA